MLSKHGRSPSAIEFLSVHLKEHYVVKTASTILFKPLRLLSMLWTLVLNSRSAKLVLIDSYSVQAFWYTCAIAFLARLLRLPYIPIMRGGAYLARFEKSNAICRWLFGGSAKNVSPSIYLAKEFSKQGIETFYLPNSIPIDNYRFIKRSEIRSRILWVRAFHQTYNPLLAIDVLHKIHESFPAAELCMVGAEVDGLMAKAKEKCNELGIEHQVKFTGMLHKHEWINLGEDYDIFINTTNVDNQPVSVIEAMALGFPIVSTNVGGIPYLIEDQKNGLLVPPGDPEAMADAIIRVLKNPQLCEKLSRNARVHAETFDWSNIEPKWLEIIESCRKP